MQGRIQEFGLGARDGGRLRESIRRVRGQSPQRGPEAEPLIRGSEQNPMKPKNIYFFDAHMQKGEIWPIVHAGSLGSFENGPTEQVLLPHDLEIVIL